MDSLARSVNLDWPTTIYLAAIIWVNKVDHWLETHSQNLGPIEGKGRIFFLHIQSSSKYCPTGYFLGCCCRAMKCNLPSNGCLSQNFTGYSCVLHGYVYRRLIKVSYFTCIFFASSSNSNMDTELENPWYIVVLCES